MANSMKGHIDFNERQKWNQAVTDIANHKANANIHIPTPPSSGNYYLGNDLKWHQVPVATISV